MKFVFSRNNIYFFLFLFLFCSNLYYGNFVWMGGWVDVIFRLTTQFNAFYEMLKIHNDSMSHHTSITIWIWMLYTRQLLSLHHHPIPANDKIDWIRWKWECIGFEIFSFPKKKRNIVYFLDLLHRFLYSGAFFLQFYSMPTNLMALPLSFPSNTYNDKFFMPKLEYR